MKKTTLSELARLIREKPLLYANEDEPTYLHRKSASVFMTICAFIQKNKSKYRNLRGDQHYTGAARLTLDGKECPLPLFPDAALELFQCLYELQHGTPFDDSLVESAFFPEFITNVKITSNGLHFITNKYMGMQLSRVSTTLIDDEESEDALRANSLLLDFGYNIIQLELKTIEQMFLFFTRTAQEGDTFILLTDDEVGTLSKYGVHENFHEDSYDDYKKVAPMILSSLGQNTLHPQNMVPTSGITFFGRKDT
jgi:hypothetical protein